MVMIPVRDELILERQDDEDAVWWINIISSSGCIVSAVFMSVEIRIEWSRAKGSVTDLRENLVAIYLRFTETASIIWDKCSKINT